MHPTLTILPLSFCSRGGISAVLHCTSVRRRWGGDLGAICQTLPRGSVVGYFLVTATKNYFLLHRNLLHDLLLQLTDLLWYLLELCNLKGLLLRIATGTVHVVSYTSLQHQRATHTFFWSIVFRHLGSSFWLGRSPRNLLWKKTKPFFSFPHVKVLKGSRNYGIWQSNTTVHSHECISVKNKTMPWSYPAEDEKHLVFLMFRQQYRQRLQNEALEYSKLFEAELNLSPTHFGLQNICFVFDG